MPIIEKVIGKEVDYVLVLQTPEMVSRAESYFHKEIKEAMERNRRFAQGFRFVIPCILKSCDSLPELKDLHCIDLVKSDGIDELVQTIHEDWQKRPSKQNDTGGDAQ